MIKVNVLWTGGMDSTYLVTKFCKIEGLTIQPFYLLDEKRRSYKKELGAIKSITRMLRNKKTTKAKLLDCHFVDINSIMEDSDISEAVSRLHDKYVLGSQYDVLVRMAKQFNVKFAVGWEKSDRSKAYAALNGETTLLKKENGLFTYQTIDESKSTADGNIIFSHFIIIDFLFSITKVDEMNSFISMGDKDIMKKTWFCHHPVLGFPCGHCNPCKDAIAEGMQFRVPLIGFCLGALSIPIWKVINKIRVIVCKDN